MLSQPTEAPDPQRMTRVPLEKPVAVRYRLFRHFVEEVSANISLGGMFLKSSSPRPPGSQFDFEFTLGEDFALVQGRGEVVWVRRQADGPGRPAGMGVRFLELDEESASVIKRLVDRYRESGRIPFELARELNTGGVERNRYGEEQAVALAVERPPAEAVRTESGTRWRLLGSGGSGTRSHPRLVLTALVSAALTALLLMLFQYLYVQPIIRGLEERVEQLAADSTARLEARRSAAGGREKEPEPAAAAETAGLAQGAMGAETPRPSVRETLRAWSGAWSEQRLDDYLSFYSRRFRPPEGLDRDAWEAERRARILRPRLIQVSVTLLSQEEVGPDERRVSFTQSYLSDRYSDIVRKGMTLVWEEGGWKILEERSER